MTNSVWRSSIKSIHLKLASALIIFSTGVDSIAANRCAVAFAAAQSLKRFAVSTEVIEQKAAKASLLDAKFQAWKSAEIANGRRRESFAAEDIIRGDEIWAETIMNSASRSDWFRGMFLKPNGQALREIVELGHVTRGDNKIYFAKDPTTALSYMRTTEIGNPNGPHLRVIIQVGKDAGVRRESGWSEPYGISRKTIPPSQIKKIYIFDPYGPDEFPFLEFTPRQLRSFLKEERRQ